MERVSGARGSVTGRQVTRSRPEQPLGLLDGQRAFDGLPS